MHGGSLKFVFIILFILLLIDLYAFRGLRFFTSGWSSTAKIIVNISYWLIPVFIVLMTIIIIQKMPELSSGKLYYRTFYTFMGVMVLFYVPKLIFSVFELGNDLSNMVVFIVNKIKPGDSFANLQVFRYSGAVLAGLVFFFTFFGIVHGRYHYKVNKLLVESSRIPKAFEGFRIVQISDWHIGSFYGKPHRVQEAVDRINALKPDLILFTGDLVNNVAGEAEEFIEQLSQLHAPYGIYSILGNHDYGDYVRWPSPEAAEKNLEELKEIHKKINFKLLNNTSVFLEKEKERINLIGIENWGLPPFPQYGNLAEAMQGIDTNAYKILLSHDPSHWDAEVINQTDIDLTLAGHTHGMQFGIDLGGWKWSMVKFKYPRWSGMYKHKEQLLYVNVGIGYIGFPGRVGIRPEIAVIELKNK